MILEQMLSQIEILDRRDLTLKVVNHTCSLSPWNQIISYVNLFGSLGCNAGKQNSDVDVAFFSSRKFIPDMSAYEERISLLYYSINKCREMYSAAFIINPVLVLDSWNGFEAKSRLRPDVLKAANEGMRIWPM